MTFKYLKQALTSRHGKPKDRVKRALGAVLYPSATRRWMDYVQSSPLLDQATEHCPLLLSKIYRPYLSARLSCAERVDALVTHYRCLRRLGLDALAAAALRDSQRLHVGQGKAGPSFEIQLSAMHEGHREGELCLRLVYEGECLFVLNFIFFEQCGRLCMKVGRLQGQAGERGRELVRQATRDLHGCRPAALLVCAARQFARLTGCDTMLLVCNRQRIALNPWRRWKIRANYNQTWSELGAVQRPDGWFELHPLAWQDADLSDVPSRKRSEVRKRIAMLDAMYRGLAQALDRPVEPEPLVATPPLSEIRALASDSLT